MAGLGELLSVIAKFFGRILELAAENVTEAVVAHFAGIETADDDPTYTSAVIGRNPADAPRARHVNDL